jgi:hypothetical protein
MKMWTVEDIEMVRETEVVREMRKTKISEGDIKIKNIK